MTAPIFWPVDFYYEPIGSTAASCLTRDLPPEASANILTAPIAATFFLLHFASLRTVSKAVPHSSTVDCEATYAAQRNLDFTCSDVDPGILG